MVRDLDTPPPRRLHLTGPAGRLAATFERPRAEPLAAVLHLHPHPEHGGTRRNNVVRHGALGSVEAGCAALRVDFRGAGDSDGEYAGGTGEVDDAAAAFRWLGRHVPGVPRFVWGFSFGARVGLDLALRLGEEQDGYLAVAWPTRFYEWPQRAGWPRRSAFLTGSEDDFVDFALLEHARRQGGVLTTLDGAGHFFPGRLDEVRSWTRDALKGWLAAL